MIFSKGQAAFAILDWVASAEGRRRKSVLNEGTVRMTRIFLGPETDNGDSKLIGKKPKRVQESLLFCGGADFREIHTPHLASAHQRCRRKNGTFRNLPKN